MAHPVQRIAGFDCRHVDTSIDAITADRTMVFIGQPKWPFTIGGDVAEIDQYDCDDTVYIIVGDAGTGSVLGSVRLLPTDRSHLLGDKFPQLCADGVPRAGDVWEITRLLSRPGLSQRAAGRVREYLAVAIVEYGLAHGISRYTMMAHTTFLPTLLAAGWDCRPLGLPHVIDGVATAALTIAIDAAALRRLRDTYGFGEALLQSSLDAIGTGGASGS